MKKILRTGAALIMLALTNIPYTIGKTNGSGIGKDIYFIPASDITAWPTITDDLDDAENFTGYVKYTGNFSLKSGACFIKAYNVQGEGVVTAEATGDRDSKMFVNKLHFRIPKMTDEAMAFANAVVNGDGVFIVWHDGAWRVIGNEHYRTDVTPNVTSGDAAGSSKGITIDAECPDYKALPIYEGNLVLEGGTFSCADGTFTPKGN